MGPPSTIYAEVYVALTRRIDPSELYPSKNDFEFYVRLFYFQSKFCVCTNSSRSNGKVCPIIMPHGRRRNRSQSTKDREK